jgi:hypothetical protein
LCNLIGEKLAGEAPIDLREPCEEIDVYENDSPEGGTARTTQGIRNSARSPVELIATIDDLDSHLNPG